MVSDAHLRPLDEEWGDHTTDEDERATSETGFWQADLDRGWVYSTSKDVGAHEVWGTTDPNNRTRRLTGHGVGFALIDTGVAPVEGLPAPGRLINGRRTPSRTRGAPESWCWSPPAAWNRRSWSGVEWSRRCWTTMQFQRRTWTGDDFARRSWSTDHFNRRSWTTSDVW